MYETYENCTGIVGQLSADGKVLLPIGHTLIKAHITITIDVQGNLLRAEALEDRGETIAPCTEESDSRSGTRPVPHPLVDKLQYLAGDYMLYAADDKDVSWAYEQYLKELREWCDSPHAHPKVQAILAYIAKGRLIEDLVAQRILHLDSNGKVLDKWSGTKEHTPEIFKIPNCTPSKVSVRFRVLGLSGDDRVWMDAAVRESFLGYLPQQQQKVKEAKEKELERPENPPGNRLCYLTGKVVPYMDMHPKKIVNTLANAKLVSANDFSGLTYRGRFDAQGEALSIGYEASLKAHYALRYLVETRGIHCGTQTIVAWGTKNESLPPPVSDSDEYIPDEEATAADLHLDAEVRTEAAYAQRLKKALYGGKYDRLDQHADVVVMALDCATVGRLSITFYRELKGNEYLERIYQWHTRCIWLHSKKGGDGAYHTYIGAPSSRDIALAAYGRNVDDKVQRATVERLLPCIFSGTRIPSDLVHAAVTRASQPMAMERWEWNRTLSIACALYNKQHEKEELGLALNESRKERSYLFGRLLAVADQLEYRALLDAGEKRETNAMRLMSAFAQRPVKTWTVIAGRLRSYQKKLGGLSRYYDDLITRIMSMFDEGDYDSVKDKPLDGLYLLGYHNQRQAFLDAIKEAKVKKDAEKLSALGNVAQSIESEEE
ncbi:MAG: type I-C CRISPR-associated protein Cas8c/Csd1 [Bacillota bacterium]